MSLDDALDTLENVMPEGWALAGLQRSGADYHWLAYVSAYCPDDLLFGCAGFREVSATGEFMEGAIRALAEKLVADGVPA